MSKETRLAAETINLELPLADPPEGCFLPGHINVRLSHRQRKNLRRLVEGLDRSGATLANGRRVVDAANAVRYMLERVEST